MGLFMKKERTVRAIMEEVIHDPEVAQLSKEAQRECGTLTPEEELRRQICDFTTPLFDISMELKKKWDAVHTTIL